MAFDVVNQHVAKIILATEAGDSITRIAAKIGTSYGWTHEWVTRLEDLGVIERDEGVWIVDEGFASAVETVAKAAVRRELVIDDAYLLPNFSSMEYAYTRTDAVYLWTKGGYQVGRNRDDYPIFIAVHHDDVRAWEAFFAEFGVPTAIDERRGDGIYVVLHPQASVEAEWVDHAAVAPLTETIAWMEERAAAFQPALEMIEELYDVDVGVV